MDRSNTREKYGFPHTTEHRSALAGGMLNGCKKEEAITLHFSISLESIQSFEPKVRFTVKPCNGEAYAVEADVLLAADGIKSRTRTQLLAEAGEEPLKEADTGQAAYRIMLKRENMAGDPDLLALLDSDMTVRWIGNGRQIVAYPVSGHSIYNLSTTQADINFAAEPSATYTTRGSKSAMLGIFADFCPLVQRMLRLVPDDEVCEWKLRQHLPLPRWTHGCVALLGDACHASLPHLGQGAAMALEDAAVLAEVLSRATDPDADVPRCLKVYERLRKDRTTMLMDMAASSGRTLLLGKGKARRGARPAVRAASGTQGRPHSRQGSVAGRPGHHIHA